ncbi:MAG TPA: proline racemase family protein [Solirubrobacteraceae bacterium]|nr:proline racemase family protein [Solirubrobacteraceae bacterium]
MTPSADANPSTSIAYFKPVDADRLLRFPADYMLARDRCRFGGQVPDKGNRARDRDLGSAGIRGNPSLLAVALFPPASDQNPWRVVFMDAAGYPDMCGHATIGVATTLVEIGLVEAASGASTLALDTPGGMVQVDCT